MDAVQEALNDEMFRRLIQIVNLLQANPEGLSVAQIADRCGVSPEIVRSDLGRLCEFGRAPLMSSLDEINESDALCEWQDREDALIDPADETWSLASANFAFPITSLTRSEAYILLKVLDRASEDSATASAKRRVIGSVASMGSASRVTRAVGRRVVKAGRTMYGPGQEESKLDELGEYVARFATVHLIYADRYGNRSQRDVCAVALVYDWRTCAWYLYGYLGPDKGYRHFKLVRIDGYSVSCHTIDPPDESEVEEHVKTCWGVECYGDPKAVAVRFSDDFNVLELMYADTADRLHAKYEMQEDGSVIYRDVMPGWNEFRTWVATFGESAEVLEPLELRASMAEAVNRVLERYQVG